ncbi:MAG: hypothetical protein ACR2O1_02355 [Boseongicola sp.]
MSREEVALSMLDALSLGGADDQTTAILAVGDSDEWLRQGNRSLTDGSIVFVSIEEVTPTLLDRLCPAIVISPALSHRFDCIDLAQILHRLRFKGRYRAVSNELPNPEMIKREIGHLCPGLDFAVLIAN